MHLFYVELYTCLDVTSNVGVKSSNLVSLSCLKHSLMYQSRSMITVPDPLSAALDDQVSASAQLFKGVTFACCEVVAYGFGSKVKNVTLYCMYESV